MREQLRQTPTTRVLPTPVKPPSALRAALSRSTKPQLGTFDAMRREGNQR